MKLDNPLLVRREDPSEVAPQVPEIAEPFRARTQHVIFVARGPQ